MSTAAFTFDFDPAKLGTEPEADLMRAILTIPTLGSNIRKIFSQATAADNQAAYEAHNDLNAGVDYLDHGKGEGVLEAKDYPGVTTASFEAWFKKKLKGVQNCNVVAKNLTGVNIWSRMWKGLTPDELLKAPKVVSSASTSGASASAPVKGAKLPLKDRAEAIALKFPGSVAELTLGQKEQIRKNNLAKANEERSRPAANWHDIVDASYDQEMDFFRLSVYEAVMNRLETIATGSTGEAKHAQEALTYASAIMSVLCDDCFTSVSLSSECIAGKNEKSSVYKAIDRAITSTFETTLETLSIPANPVFAREFKRSFLHFRLAKASTEAESNSGIGTKMVRKVIEAKVCSDNKHAISRLQNVAERAGIKEKQFSGKITVGHSAFCSSSNLSETLKANWKYFGDGTFDSNQYLIALAAKQQIITRNGTATGAGKIEAWKWADARKQMDAIVAAPDEDRTETMAAVIAKFTVPRNRT